MSYYKFHSETIKYTSTIFTLNTSPIKTMHRIKYLKLPFLAAIDKAHSAKSKNIIRIVSIVLFLITTAKNGVIARNNPVKSPAAVSKDFFTK